MAEPGQPGAFANVPNDRYHDLPGESHTALKHALRSPAHYRAYLAREYAETPAQRLGRAVHVAVLEWCRFEEAYAVEPDLSKNSNKYKEWKFDLPDGVEPISSDDRDLCLRIRDAVMAHSRAGNILTFGVAERSYWWTDPESGLLCKCRPDFMRVDEPLIVDLKTAVSAEYEDFQRAIVRYKYHLQPAHYLAGVSSVEGTPYTDWLWLVVEKEAPYGVKLYAIDSELLRIGRDEVRRALMTVKDAREANRWPCYSEEIEQMYPPPWML